MRCVFFLFIIVWSFPGKGQKLTTNILPGTSSLYETYLKKSGNKLKAARILGWSAVGLTAGSAAFYVRAKRQEKHSSDTFAGLSETVFSGGLGIAAIGAGVTAILLNASAKNYKKKAVTLKPVVTTIPVHLPGKSHDQPVAGIALHF